jgi:hypothetical protein
MASQTNLQSYLWTNGTTTLRTSVQYPPTQSFAGLEGTDYMGLAASAPHTAFPSTYFSTPSNLIVGRYRADLYARNPQRLADCEAIVQTYYNETSKFNPANPRPEEWNASNANAAIIASGPSSTALTVTGQDRTPPLILAFT